ncbi:MAG: hypothetical protein HYZ28_26100 [Myxococcales bacterium]|nr:hypothetical protein [Myxococcales bacterium]
MRWLKLGPAALIALSVAYWFAMRRDWLPSHPEVLAALVGGALALLLLNASLVAVSLGRKTERPARGGAKLLLLGGLVAVGAGGLANWVLQIRGAIILFEREPVPLGDRHHALELRLGPLAWPQELEMTIALEKLELLPAEGGLFYPRSKLQLLRPGASTPTKLEVDHSQVGGEGRLRFYQGAFGFAPRIVVEKSGAKLFDQPVPFRTLPQGNGALTFSGELAIEREGLQVEGALDISSLDERMKGHPVLRVQVRQGEKGLGHGELTLGHFVELEGGYRVGFAGLGRWSEIDFTRRNYREVVLLGALAAAVGLLGLVATFRRRRSQVS